MPRRMTSLIYDRKSIRVEIGFNMPRRMTSLIYDRSRRRPCAPRCHLLQSAPLIYKIQTICSSRTRTRCRPLHYSIGVAAPCNYSKSADLSFDHTDFMLALLVSKGKCFLDSNSTTTRQDGRHAWPSILSKCCLNVLLIVTDCLCSQDVKNPQLPRTGS
jgi:hypothetical protein